MSVYACMLRGINVTGYNKIGMKELKGLFQSLGHANVTTYIQSGNVVFASDRSGAPELAGEIEQQIAAAFGLNVPALLRTGDELAQVLAQNPYTRGGRDPARLHVTFLREAPDPDFVGALEGFDSSPDEFAIAAREVYLHCPAGYGNTKLNNTFWERRLKVVATTRNWNTVARLAEMGGSSQSPSRGHLC
jgi:uncharacterized protein (DUF1697 family)